MTQQQTEKSETTADDSANKGKKTYLEILGDTVLPNQLFLAIILNIVICLGSYNIGLWFFPKIAGESMVASYSLLLGIVGTILSLALCSFIFKPKRILMEEDTSYEGLQEVFQDLQLDPREELALIENDPITKRELEELGVLNQFRALGSEKRE